MIQKIKKFFEETRQEWKHVNWPTGREAAYLTVVVIGLSLLLALLLGAFDYLFLAILRLLVA